MNKKEYTREYLRDNFEFPDRRITEYYLHTEYIKLLDGTYEVTYKPFKPFDSL